LVGVNTIISDDPSLLPISKKNFARIVLDSSLRIPLKARIFQDRDKADTLVFTTSRSDKDKLLQLDKKGIKVVIMEEEDGKVSLVEVLKKLGELEIMNLLVEGGGEVIGSFFEKRSVDKIFLFLAPRIIGGRRALTWVEGKGVDFLEETPLIEINSVKKIGGDFLLEGRVR
jgi:diaminohydroxyphosphoribosylaminopyrimidine deaminase/5-amino-6-(5-phosphoribosylamino)uracil reductase